MNASAQLVAAHRQSHQKAVIPLSFELFGQFVTAQRCGENFEELLNRIPLNSTVQLVAAQKCGNNDQPVVAGW